MSPKAINDNNRIHWIDCAKGVGIFLVVLGHIYKDNSVTTWIYSFHMPLFFVLSGWVAALFKTKEFSFKRNLLSKSKSLLLPFVVFRCLLIVYWFLVERHFRELDLGPIWFLITLYVTCITILPLFRYCKSLSNKAVVTLINIVAYYCYITLLPTQVKENLHLVTWGLASNVWFSLGYLIKMSLENLQPVYVNKCYRGGVRKALLISTGIISIGFYNLNDGVSVYSGIINNYVLYLLFGLAGTYVVCGICKIAITSNKFLEYWGRNSIVLLAIHEPIKRVILKLVEVSLNKMGIAVSHIQIQSNVLSGFAIGIIVLGISYIVILCIRYARFHTGLFGRYVLAFVK